MLKQFRLNEKDRSAIRDLLIEISRHEENLEESIFLGRALLFAQELPLLVREVIYDFKLRESSTALLITNNPLIAGDVGVTPVAHWKKGEKRPLNLAQLMHGLYSNLLGEPFGFETQQNGRIFNDLISIPGSHDSSSSGSGKVGLHTEDCCQPFMPDYLGLMCLRNDQNATTTFSSIRDFELPADAAGMLFDQSFPFRNSVTPKPVLFGDRKRPYLRYGPVDYERCSRQMADAVQLLSDALQRNFQTVVLKQGDCLYMDNFVTVHGRAPFRAEHGPRGRWFSRLVMLRDLRATRSLRTGPEERVMLQGRYN